MTSTLRQRLPIDVLPSGPEEMHSASSSDSGMDSGSESHLPPYTPPNYTIKDLLGAIPAHCFERSALRSSAFIVQDFLMLGAAVYLASHIDSAFGFQGKTVAGYAGIAAKWAAWTAYWAMAGWNFTGIWIIGGHQAFSTSKQLNNAVGLVLHSFVLVPYHSWRISHSKHHAATGHMTREEVFVPSTRSDKGEMKPRRKVMVGDMELDELLEDAPMYRLYHIMIQQCDDNLGIEFSWEDADPTLVLEQLFGWPAYLFSNASGQATYPKGTNHFDPASTLFDARHRGQILLSDAGLAVTISALCVFGHYQGFASVVKYYLIPYLLVNHWLVMITYLQHTDPNLPHYRAGEWTFPRGALCTIDRNMLGPVGPYLMHGICETHISHHISSKIPHYHAWEATEALKAFLGVHYTYTDENMFVSLWKNFSLCRFVEDEGEVVFYKDSYGRAARSVVLEGVPSDSGVDVQ